MIKILQSATSALDATRRVDFLAPLALRLYLAPVFWVAGMNKVRSFDNTVAWFGNADWGLGLPFPWLMAFLATATEVVGAVLLLLGLGTRWVSLPLMVVMVVAATQVHWHNGWQAVADRMSAFPPANIDEVMTRLDRARLILRENGDWDWLTEHGNFIISNNGIEWAVTYFVMLLALFFIGGGRYLSADWWIRRRFGP